MIDMMIEDFPQPTGPSIPMRLPFLTSMLISNKIKLFSPPHVLTRFFILRATVGYTCSCFDNHKAMNNGS